VRIQNNVHNKGFVFDHKKVVVSSQNWSSEGVLNNRDAGVILDNASAAAYYEKVFLDDWANHAVQKMVAS
jgi:phosphatidylserine/phosphatidylglycerophosphate/cardiolipin synthase-like enzyme